MSPEEASESGPSCRRVKAGFNERCCCRNATSNPFPERTIRPQSYHSGFWCLAIPLFQWSLKGSKYWCTESDGIMNQNRRPVVGRNRSRPLSITVFGRRLFIDLFAVPILKFD
jgi:hypothetical protein